MSKQGVKRTGKAGKRSGLSYQEQINANYEEIRSKCISAGKILGQIYMLIALGRMGFGKKRIEDLHEIHKEVMKEYGDIAHEDLKGDSEAIYARAVMWRELSTMFDDMPSYEEIFDLSRYSEGIRMIDVREMIKNETN